MYDCKHHRGFKMPVSTQLIDGSLPTATVPAAERPASATAATDTSDLTYFPEARFQPSAANRAAYLRALTAGYSTMRNQRVVLAGLARDVAWVLPRTMARLERLGSLFADYRIVIYENDSADETLDMLTRWARENRRVTVLSEERHDPVNIPIRCLQRAERMAYYRNQYREYIVDRYSDYDAVGVVDTDLEGGWSYDGVAHTFGHMEWDAVGSYGILYKRRGLQSNRAIHFDAWAFRAAGSHEPLSNSVVNSMQWERGEPFVPVTSCFGGLAVYRMPAFSSSEYDGHDAEHVGLHRRMAASGHGRIFLNPSQITLYGRRWRKLDGLVRICQQLAAAARMPTNSVWY